MPGPSFTPDSLVAFVERERAAAAAEERRKDGLSLDDLVERGDAVRGLTIVAASSEGLVLRCPENESRLRVGDLIELQAADGHFTGTIADLRDDGREVRLRSVQTPRRPGSGPWTARALPVDVSALVIACLKRLQPGAAGWAFFHTCTGESLADPPARDRAPCASSVTEAVLGEQAVDASQKAVFRRCLDLPDAFAVQGPPGTGKTRVLAMVAEALARTGKRTLVLAPTHQAVNNALSTRRRRQSRRRWRRRRRSSGFSRRRAERTRRTRQRRHSLPRRFAPVCWRACPRTRSPL